MEINWKKKLIKFKNGSYVCFGIKRRKYIFNNKNELKLNASISNHFESQIEALEKVIQDKNDFICHMQDYIMFLQKQCGIEPGNYCEIINRKDGTIRKFIRRGKDHEEIKI